MKTEDTIYDNEGTQFEETQFETSQDSKKGNKKSPFTKSTGARIARSTAMGGIMGVLLGTTTSFVTADSIINEENPEKPEKPTENNEDIDHPEWTDGQVEVATSVNDDMTFGEAFAAARTEVGTGGSFEWHGNVYSTYTAEEWNSMSPEEKEEYNNHFYWSNHTNAYNDSSDTIEAVEVSQENTTEAIVAQPMEPEIEVLGIVHDTESGANVASLMVDEQQVVMVDIDGDEIVDYVASDYNHDGGITPDEVGNVSSYQFGLNQLQDESLYASNDNMPDYINDATV